MSVTIFSRESGSTEEWLIVNDDGTLTYEKENAGWVMARKGAQRRTSTMSVEEAKKKWPNHALAIDAALKEIENNKQSK